MSAVPSHRPARRVLAHLAVFLVVALTYLSGALEFVECKLADLRFGLLERGVSGDLVLVEIDARSLRTLEGWPWPRSYHAQIVDTLRLAGAERIALDVDFSSYSTRPGDDALADALDAAGGRAVLPVFAQMTRGVDGDERLVLTRPLPQFQRNATLGSVNVAAGSDGLVRRMATHPEFGAQPVPAFFTVIAGRDGDAPQDFFVDYGIRLDAIARLSFVDVLLGRFDPAQVAGKRIIIGATALELGDAVAVPVLGTIHGPELQALAYESLVQDRAIRPLPPGLTLLVVGLIVGSAGWGFARLSWRLGLGLLAGGGLVLFGAGTAVQAAAPVMVDLAPGLSALTLSYVLSVIGRVDQLDLRLLAQGLALRRAGAFMRQVVDNSLDGIVTIDAAGRIKSMNRAAEAVLGAPADRVLGTSFYRLLATGTWQGLVAEDRFHAEPQEIRRTRPDGTCSAIQVSISRTEVADERLHIAILRDITAQKRAEKTAEQARLRLNEAIERINEGFALYDPDGNLALSNRTFRDLAPRLPGPTGSIDLATVASDEAAADYREIVLDDGTWLRVSERPTVEGGAVAVYADITELKRREYQLEATAREAEAANRSKTAFLANMSHELRTPLNAIIGFSETMVTELLGPVGTPQYKDYAGDILASGQHLLDIITDILDVSKIEAGELQLAPEALAVDAVIEDALRMTRERAASSGHRIATELPENLPDLYVDRRAVLQVLLNLLSNAIKFTPEGGEIAVRVAVEADQALAVAIVDTGIGMAAEDIPRALSLFGQVEGVLQRTYEGTGLGLPLSEKLMALHGGSMGIESAVGVGTTILLRFPAERMLWPDLDGQSTTARAG